MASYQDTGPQAGAVTGSELREKARLETPATCVLRRSGRAFGRGSILVARPGASVCRHTWVMAVNVLCIHAPRAPKVEAETKFSRLQIAAVAEQIPRGGSGAEEWFRARRRALSFPPGDGVACFELGGKARTVRWSGAAESLQARSSDGDEDGSPSGRPQLSERVACKHRPMHCACRATLSTKEYRDGVLSELGGLGVEWALGSASAASRLTNADRGWATSAGSDEETVAQARLR
ncbi:hypothetical protein C8Q79DRAFT_771054 [Trametes meyenii]|nr:hypothetical protein C8Q79DRAFT_771054 [Trametes meyenii]